MTRSQSSVSQLRFADAANPSFKKFESRKVFWRRQWSFFTWFGA